MTKIILFNGPPRSGKDTAAKITMDMAFPRAYFYRFATPVKDAVHALFGMPGIMEEHFTNVKSEPCDRMLGFTPRELYIWISEVCAKPKFGNDFFAKIAVKNILAVKRKDVIVVSDCGFQEEVDAMISAFGAPNVRVVAIQRKGCDFVGDSRQYVRAESMVWIENNGSLKELKAALTDNLGDFINGER